MVILAQISSQKVREAALIKASCPKGVLFPLLFNDRDGSVATPAPSVFWDLTRVSANWRRTRGSPSSRYLCVGVGPKRFPKETPVPAPGSLLCSSLCGSSPRRLPKPSVLTSRCQGRSQLPAGSVFSCGHRVASFLPLVRNQTAFHCY